MLSDILILCITDNRTWLYKVYVQVILEVLVGTRNALYRSDTNDRPK
jgi:hypothetical protein